jgi:outer membrane receptor protein involved in Fe transport
MEANQYDAAVEWYFSPQGSLYSTVFYKDVKNYFIRGTQTQSLFGLDWQVDAPSNGDQGVIKGFEIGYSQFYDFLPGIFKGFGLQANYTYVDSEGAPGPRYASVASQSRSKMPKRESIEIKNVVLHQQPFPAAVRTTGRWVS